MTTPTTLGALDYYARFSCALFPILPGSKAPTGIIESFAHDHSSDPAVWATWRSEHPGCNFGLFAAGSRLIVVDIDIKAGRDAAWSEWCAICAKWGIPVATPHVQSARGGWHVYFSIPDHVDAASLRQPDLSPAINVRAGNGYVVAAGSTYNDADAGPLPYILLSNAAPYPAPTPLVEHCTRSHSNSTTGVGTGRLDSQDVASFLKWLTEHDAFEAYEDWVSVGMALKIEFGDVGLPLWRLTFDDTVTDDVEDTKWRSFSSEPGPGCITLNSFLKRAHEMGWKGSLREPVETMFAGATVAQLAANAGAVLPSTLDLIAGHQKALATRNGPALDVFLSATVRDIQSPRERSYPTLPETFHEHPLFKPLRTAISRIVAAGEAISPTGKGWKAQKYYPTLGLLHTVDLATCTAVVQRLHMYGCNVSMSKIESIANRLNIEARRETSTFSRFRVNGKTNEPINNNSDNVRVLVELLDVELRWNAWIDRAEIRSNAQAMWKDWTYVDDAVVAAIFDYSESEHVNFHPSEAMMWRSILTISKGNIYDPALTLLDTLSGEWDGVARLDTWLAKCCDLPSDGYHTAVARNIVGGMVHRVRNAGCKHDTMAIFYGPQGTGKSTMARILAMSEDWFSDSVLLSDAAKELVLLLAGKSVVEISEMGMRSGTSVNHVKAMVTRQADQGRTAYAKAVTSRPRRNIFIGTTNDDEPLSDVENRRFLPVKVDTEIRLNWLRQWVGQIVGEAARRDSAGESWDLPRDVWSLAAERQEAARTVADIETLLEDAFMATDYSKSAFVTCNDLRYLLQESGIRGAQTAKTPFMRRLGFVQGNVWCEGKKTRAWVRGSSEVSGAPGVRYVVGKSQSGRVVTEIRANGGRS